MRCLDEDIFDASLRWRRMLNSAARRIAFRSSHSQTGLAACAKLALIAPPLAARRA